MESNHSSRVEATKAIYEGLPGNTITLMEFLGGLGEIVECLLVELLQALEELVDLALYLASDRHPLNPSQLLWDPTELLKPEYILMVPKPSISRASCRYTTKCLPFKITAAHENFRESDYLQILGDLFCSCLLGRSVEEVVRGGDKIGPFSIKASLFQGAKGSVLWLGGDATRELSKLIAKFHPSEPEQFKSIADLQVALRGTANSIRQEFENQNLKHLAPTVYCSSVALDHETSSVEDPRICSFARSHSVEHLSLQLSGMNLFQDASIGKATTEELEEKLKSILGGNPSALRALIQLIQDHWTSATPPVTKNDDAATRRSKGNEEPSLDSPSPKLPSYKFPSYNWPSCDCPSCDWRPMEIPPLPPIGIRSAAEEATTWMRAFRCKQSTECSVHRQRRALNDKFKVLRQRLDELSLLNARLYMLDTLSREDPRFLECETICKQGTSAGQLPRDIASIIKVHRSFSSDVVLEKLRGDFRNVIQVFHTTKTLETAQRIAIGEYFGAGFCITPSLDLSIGFGACTLVTKVLKGECLQNRMNFDETTIEVSKVQADAGKHFVGSTGEEIVVCQPAQLKVDFIVVWDDATDAGGTSVTERWRMARMKNQEKILEEKRSVSVQMERVATHIRMLDLIEHIPDDSRRLAYLSREEVEMNTAPSIYSAKAEIIRVSQTLYNRRAGRTVFDPPLLFACGTGSDETKQVPQYILDWVLHSTTKAPSRVLVLVPTGLIARSLARDITELRKNVKASPQGLEFLGGEVGYFIEGDKKFDLNGQGTTRIVFMTYLMFLQSEWHLNPFLYGWDFILFDDAHTLDVNLVVGLIPVMQRRCPRVVFGIMSGTLSDSLRLSSQGLRKAVFGCTRSFFVEVVDRLSSDSDAGKACLLAVKEIVTGQKGVRNILAFLPTTEAAKKCAEDAAKDPTLRSFHCMCLHATSPPNSQEAIFRDTSMGKPTLIFGTSYAEGINRFSHVVDTGRPCYPALLRQGTDVSEQTTFMHFDFRSETARLMRQDRVDDQRPSIPAFVATAPAGRFAGHQAFIATAAWYCTMRQACDFFEEWSPAGAIRDILIPSECDACFSSESRDYCIGTFNPLGTLPTRRRLTLPFIESWKHLRRRFGRDFIRKALGPSLRQACDLGRLPIYYLDETREDPEGWVQLLFTVAEAEDAVFANLEKKPPYLVIQTLQEGFNALVPKFPQITWDPTLPERFNRAMTNKVEFLGLIFAILEVRLGDLVHNLQPDRCRLIAEGPIVCWDEATIPAPSGEGSQPPNDMLSKQEPSFSKRMTYASRLTQVLSSPHSLVSETGSLPTQQVQIEAIHRRITVGELIHADLDRLLPTLTNDLSSDSIVDLERFCELRTLREELSTEAYIADLTLRFNDRGLLMEKFWERRGQATAIEKALRHHGEIKSYALKKLSEPNDFFGELVAMRAAHRGMVHPDVVVAYALQEGTGEHLPRVLREIVAGLSRLHRWDVLHGDLKPERIMMDGTDPSARPKIIDFNFSTVRPRTTTVRALKTAGLAGNQGFSPPEFLSACCTLRTGLSDVFSLGKTLQEMLLLDDWALAKPSEGLNALIQDMTQEDPDERRHLCKQRTPTSVCQSVAQRIELLRARQQRPQASQEEKPPGASQEQKLANQQQTSRGRIT